MSSQTLSDAEEPIGNRARDPNRTGSGARRGPIDRRRVERGSKQRWQGSFRRMIAAFWPISKLTKRVLIINLTVLFIPIGGLLYLGGYKRDLLADEIADLEREASVIAAAIGASAVTWGEGDQFLLPETTRLLIQRMTGRSQLRARLFGPNGRLLEDSRRLAGPKGAVEIEVLPPPERQKTPIEIAFDAYDELIDRMTPGWAPQPYLETENQRAADFAETRAALNGETASTIRVNRNGALVLIAAAPVQRYKRILGVLMLSREGDGVENTVKQMRTNILRISGVALALTVLLSSYLAGTVTRPIRRLAQAAERLRQGRQFGAQPMQAQIPDFRSRKDEIGELSLALRDMTGALEDRMNAIERFAADVAHELKNPLTSLASAMETAHRFLEKAPPDAERVGKLLRIVQDDVGRMDRLISDISDASRVDSEIFRTPNQSVDLADLLTGLVALHRASDVRPPLSLSIESREFRRPGAQFVVSGVEDRLLQVFRNLIGNARSFSPEDKSIEIRLSIEGRNAIAEVLDRGPGVPADKLEKIFDRFYAERPAGEKFGCHSGLGLSISRQIVSAHRGSLSAANRSDGAGARFSVRLPLAQR